MYFFPADPCTDWSLPERPNAKRTVTAGTPAGGYTVEYQCNTNYYYYDKIKKNAVKKYTCAGEKQSFVDENGRETDNPDYCLGKQFDLTKPHFGKN